jgi:hypothetical protein
MDPKKREIKNLLIEELSIMPDPMDKDCRTNNWTTLLILLINLGRIQRYHINYNATEINFDINDFTYYVNFENEEKIKSLVRDQAIDQLLDP